jgi:hypothetical protein
MDDNRPEGPSPSPDGDRPRRDPPTIDLEASEVAKVSEPNEGADAAAQSGPSPASSAAGIFARLLVSAVTGAVTAALVIAAWTIGWQGEPAPPAVNPQTNASAIDTIATRLADLEARIARPAPPASDPAMAARFDALEKSLASLRTEVAGARAQSDKLAVDLNAVKSAAREVAAPPAELAAINQRLGEIERAAGTERAAIAQAASRPTDDAALRRVVAASMLDASVRQGEPFVAPLAAAKALAPDPAVLEPLDGFAAAGVPNPAVLSRELLALVPKLLPPPPANATTGTGIMDRLQAGAAKLVRIERTDAVGNDRGAIVARVTAAALRNDLADARRELDSLAPADRGAAQSWLDKVSAREAALAASRQFANQAMAALASPAQ